MKGPAEFGLGVAEGSKSLILHSAKGLGTAVAGLTGTVGTALAGLSFDREYMREREVQKLKDRPTNIVHGALFAGSKLGKGIFDGVSGVIAKPLEGAQKGGIGGFFKGIAQGTVGLAVKPVTGLVDAATSVAEGIASTPSQSEITPRLRTPRMLYGSDRTIKVYDPEDARIGVVLKADRTLKDSKFYMRLNTTKKTDSILAVLNWGVVMILAAKEFRISWKCPWNRKYRSKH
jgi:hypothetical protein